MNKDNFYSQGKYFDNQEEFWKYVNEWGSIELNQETAYRQLDNLKKEIVMNIFLREIIFTNQEFVEYLSNIFNYAMNLISSNEPLEEKS